MYPFVSSTQTLLRRSLSVSSESSGVLSSRGSDWSSFEASAAAAAFASSSLAFLAAAVSAMMIILFSPRRVLEVEWADGGHALRRGNACLGLLTLELAVGLTLLLSGDLSLLLCTLSGVDPLTARTALLGEVGAEFVQHRLDVALVADGLPVVDERERLSHGREPRCQLLVEGLGTFHDVGVVLEEQERLLDHRAEWLELAVLGTHQVLDPTLDQLARAFDVVTSLLAVPDEHLRAGLCSTLDARNLRADELGRREPKRFENLGVDGVPVLAQSLVLDCGVESLVGGGLGVSEDSGDFSSFVSSEFSCGGRFRSSSSRG